MSLRRAFTKRSKRPVISSPTPPARAASTRKHDGPIDRSLISAPVELLSTTNVLVYDAPDLSSISHIIVDTDVSSASSSVDSGNDSDSSPAPSSSSSISSPDNSLLGESSPSPVEPNHLSCYFRQGRASAGSNASSDIDAPKVPSRAPSHTKKSHQAIARKRSLSRMSPPPNTILPLSPAMRSSADMFSSKVEANHPFGAELEQVNELAEEFAASQVMILDEEEQFLLSNGLRKFAAQDYALEIEGLFGGVFDDSYLSMGTMWF